MNVTKIILTRCQIFHLKCTKFNFGWGSALDATLGAHSVPPDSLSVFGRGEKRRESRVGERKEGRGG